MKNRKLGCVILAAGSGARFGGNKLLALFRGDPVIQYAMEAADTACFDRVAVVTQYEPVAEMGQARGYKALWNRQPELGLSRSVILGTEAMADCDGICFLVGDQPCLGRQTVEALASAWQAQPERIVAAAHQGKRGNPCIFPKLLFEELRALSGDTGGGAVIRRHPELLRLVETGALELFDTDTPEKLRILEKEAENSR